MEESQTEYLARIVQATHDMQAQMLGMVLDIREQTARIERDQMHFANLQFIFLASMVDALQKAGAIDTGRIDAALKLMLIEMAEAEAMPNPIEMHPMAEQVSNFIDYLRASRGNPGG